MDAITVSDGTTTHYGHHHSFWWPSHPLHHRFQWASNLLWTPSQFMMALPPTLSQIPMALPPTLPIIRASDGSPTHILTDSKGHPTHFGHHYSLWWPSYSHMALWKPHIPDKNTIQHGCPPGPTHGWFTTIRISFNLLCLKRNDTLKNPFFIYLKPA